MSSYRVKQFFWSLFSRVTEEDRKYVQNHLTDGEFRLFSKLPKAEQKHCIRVAEYVEGEYESLRKNNNDICDPEVCRMIRVALLHDIGKLKRPLNVVDKSVLVMLNSISGGDLIKLQRFEKVKVYYRHGEIGADMLSQYGVDERFLFLVRNHHSDIRGDRELELLRYCDSMA